MTQNKSQALHEFEQSLNRLTRYYTDKVFRYENEMNVARDNYEHRSFQEILIDEAKAKLAVLHTALTNPQS